MKLHDYVALESLKVLSVVGTSSILFESTGLNQVSSATVAFILFDILIVLKRLVAYKSSYTDCYDDDEFIGLM